MSWRTCPACSKPHALRVATDAAKAKVITCRFCPHREVVPAPVKVKA